MATAEGGDNRGDNRGAWNEDEINLGMSKPPEEMLVQEYIAAHGGIEELSSAGSVEQEHGARKRDRGQGEDHHHRNNGLPPHEKRNAIQRHARSPQFEDRH